MREYKWWKARMVRLESGEKTRTSSDNGKRWGQRSSFRSSWFVRGVSIMYMLLGWQGMNK